MFKSKPRVWSLKKMSEKTLQPSIYMMPQVYVSKCVFGIKIIFPDSLVILSDISKFRRHGVHQCATNYDKPFNNFRFTLRVTDVNNVSHYRKQTMRK